MASGEHIVCTDNHPFFVPGSGWVPAGKLCLGTKVTPRAGPAAVNTMMAATTVTSIARCAQRAGTAATVVYNFEVEGTHTYFVGTTNGGEWVHNACEFDIVNYGNKQAGMQVHHGIMDVWARSNVPGYASRAADCPGILLSVERHRATIGVFNRWRAGRGAIDWTQVSPQEIKALSEQMFDAAGVPERARAAYYKAFDAYIYSR